MTTENDNNKEMLLTRYLAQCGLCSRRNAELLLKEGEVSVNNFIITDPSYRLKDGEVVRYKKKVIEPEEHKYILLNKPKGYVASLSDPYNERTVMDLIRMKDKLRLYPVGRLDKDTTGLLVLTNDGDLAQKLAHPKNKVRKVYEVKLNRELDEEIFSKIKRGARLKDGGAVKVDRIFYLKNRTKDYVGIEIHSGKYRVIRRLFETFGYFVKSLDRIRYDDLNKRSLPLGQWRVLKNKEVEALKKGA